MLLQDVFFGDPFDEEGPRLKGARCAGCGKTFFPARAMCSQCGAEATPIALRRQGSLYSYTFVARHPEFYQRPYFLGWMDLGDNVRVLGQLKVPSDGRPHIGAQFEVVLDELFTGGEGERIVGFKFAPVRNREGRGGGAESA